MIKAAFLRCMQRLFPRGVSDRRQMRDLALAFCMGFGEGTWFARRSEWAVIAPELEAITWPDWMPDDSWKWW